MFIVDDDRLEEDEELVENEELEEDEEEELEEEDEGSSSGSFWRLCVLMLAIFAWLACSVSLPIGWEILLTSSSESWWVISSDVGTASLDP